MKGFTSCAEAERAAIVANAACMERSRASAVGAAAAGLVPSKTTLKSVVSFSKPVVAERRVKRLKKSVWASGHLHKLGENGFRPPVCWFITLTYDTNGTLGRGRHDWAPEHISKAIQGYRNWCKARGFACRYTWVAELQGRGTVHYHLLAWLPVGVNMPFWDKCTRTPMRQQVVSPWWPHGMSNREEAYSGVGYLMKYLSKLGELTQFPKGLRLYGIGGLVQQGKDVRTWLNLPEWVKRDHGVGDVTRVGSQFWSYTTGRFLEPAYSVRKVPDGIAITLLRELPEKFHSGPYSLIRPISGQIAA